MGLQDTSAAVLGSLGATQGKLLRVEAMVLFTTLVLAFLGPCSYYRRRCSNKSFQLFSWTVYTLSPVLVSYTIGLLQAGPFHDQTFVMWATILLVLMSTDSLSVYDINDIEQRKRLAAQHGLQIILVLWLIINSHGHNKAYTATIWTFWLTSASKTIAKFKALSKASKKGGMLEHSKVIADYMMVEHELAHQDDPNVDDLTSWITGYKYIFHGEKELASMLPAGPEYRMEFLSETNRKKLTTIDSVWQRIDAQRPIVTREKANALKAITLSFTLFKLLKRRFCGYQHGEAGKQKTLHFVVGGLLSEKFNNFYASGGNFIPAFNVIEIELAFLYDFLYTRHETGLVIIGLSTVIVILVLILNAISGAFSKHYHHSNLDQRIGGKDVVYWITVALVAMTVVTWVVEIIVLPYRWRVVAIFIDKENISSRNSQIKPETGRYGIEELDIGSWERKLGQYSLLQHFDYHPWNITSLLSLRLIEATREGQKALKKIQLPLEVIVSVLSRFKENNGELADGQSALARNQLESQFSWACHLPTHIHTLLVWHIGTTLCESTSTSSSQEPPPSERIVANSLSNYCAYLVAFVPDMLPGNGYDTKRIFDAVVMEARECCAAYGETISSRCEKLLRFESRKGNILEMGAKLGRELRDSIQDEVQRWKVLADFWTEFILFLSPSSNVEIHAEKLAAGGEFMTHLWALLIHAGILERPTSSGTNKV